jgi:hypothetical protein
VQIGVVDGRGSERGEQFTPNVEPGREALEKFGMVEEVGRLAKDRRIGGREWMRS